MNELNQKLTENLGMLLLGLKDEVIQGLKEYALLNNGNLGTELI